MNNPLMNSVSANDSNAANRDNDSVTIVEVGPRDGLQNEKQSISVETKVSLIEQLADAGLSVIESGSFVSPKWVPQMAASDEVFRQISRRKGVRYTALTPNMRGLESAIACGVEEIAIFGAASEAFSQKNINCSVDESIERFKPMMALAKEHGISVRGYVSCIFACPYDGVVSAAQVSSITQKLFDLGCYEVSLGDTTGVGTAPETKTLLRQLGAQFDIRKLALHFHDTFGQAVANTYAGLEEGYRVFDASIAGLGGCPYAKGATGNVATEDVVYLMRGAGMKTGIDLEKLAQAGSFISKSLGRPSQSHVGSVLASRAQSE